MNLFARLFPLAVSFSLISNTTWAQDATNEPAELKSARSSYQLRLKQVTDPVTSQYLAYLETLKKSFGAKGDANAAIVIQKEIDSLGITAPSALVPAVGASGDKVIIWNTNNGGKGDRGTKKINLIFSSGGRETWRMNGLLLKWDATKQTKDEIKVPSVAVDKIRVEIKETVNNRGGLSEIEFIKSGQNVSQGHTVDVSGIWEKDNKHDGSKLTDGDNTSDWLIPDKGLGWAEIHLTDKK